MAQKGVSNMFVLLIRTSARPTYTNTNQMTTFGNQPKNPDLWTISTAANSWTGYYNGKRNYATSGSKKLQIMREWWPDKKFFKDEETDERDQENDEAKDNTQKWTRIKTGFVMLGAGIVSFGLWTLYETQQPPVVDAKEKSLNDDICENFTVQQQFFQKIMQDLYQMPRCPFQPVHGPYTLVLDLKCLLANLNLKNQAVQHFEKISRVGKFLQECFENISEIVVFTAEKGLTVLPILDAMDSNGYILYRSMRDAMYYIDGHHLPDLSNLKLDLKKAIIREMESSIKKPHTANISRWLGNDNNGHGKSFLQRIAGVKVNNGHGVSQYYRQMGYPILHSAQKNLYRRSKMQKTDKHSEQINISAAIMDCVPSFSGDAKA